jgi:hypothetical protein
MNKIYQNKLTYLLCIVLLAILAVCCQDEIGLPSSSGKGEFTVEDAKEFFETNVDALSVDLQLRHANASKMTREQTQGKNRVITPVWNKSERRVERNGNMEVVETPLSIGNGVSVMRDMLYKGKRKVEISQTYSKLVIRHFRQENVTVSHIVTFIADKRFSGRDKDITKLRYNDWKKFSGFVLYTTTDGCFTNGYKMINGKITHRLYLRELTKNITRSTTNVRMVYNYVDNSEVTPAFMSDFEKYYCGTCDAWYDWDEVCDHEKEIVGDEYCQDCGRPKDDCICGLFDICDDCGHYQDQCVCTYCPICGQKEIYCSCPKPCSKCGEYGCDGSCDYHCFKCGSHYCDGSCDEGSGGGDDGDNTSQKVQRAKKIFRNSNMTEANWKILGDMLDKIIQDCMGEALYNGLESLLNGKTMTIEFISGNDSEFYFNGSSTGIRIGMNRTESNHLLHEMFHCYQVYHETTTTYSGAKLNIEIEAHYAQYLFTSRLPEYPNSPWSEKYEKKKRYNAIKRLERIINEKGELLPNQTSNDLKDYIDETVKKEFTKNDIYNQYTFDDSRTPLQNFSNLQNLTKGC